MYMLHRDSQSYKLIHKPSYIDLPLFFRDHNQVISLLSIFMAKFYHQLIRRSNRLFHFIQTTVTWYPYDTFSLETQLKSTRGLFNGQLYIDFTFLNFRAINMSEKKIVK